MAKNILAFFGLIFLTLLVLGAVAFMGFFYDSLGMISLPPAIRGIPATLQAMNEVKVRVEGPNGPIEWKNPLEGMGDPTMPFILPTAVLNPTPIPTATKAPTATPVPPLDPQVYQVETMQRLKVFATALQRWLDLNQKAGQNPDLMQDPSWQQDMRASLDEVSSSGRALSAVGPSPWEYRTIDALLDRASKEADDLVWYYRRGIENGSSDDLKTAGESFSRLKGYLQQAAEQMLALGWEIR